MADVTKTLKDAAYVAIGLGVLAFQKAQVRRVELTKQLDEQRKQFETQASEAREQFAKLVKGIDERFEPVIQEIDSRLDTIEERLPQPTKTFVHQTRQFAKASRAEMRNRVNGAAA